MAVDGPRNSRGEPHVLPGTGINGWTVTLISRNCKDPEKAMKLLTYLMSEAGQKMTYLGVEGPMYETVDGQPRINAGVLRMMQNDRAEYDRIYGGNVAYWMLQDNVTQLKWRPPLEPPMGQLEAWTYPYTDYLGQYEINFNINSPAGDADRKIKLLWSTVLPQLLLAPSETEFDELFQSFVVEREALGFDSVLAESTGQMQAAKEKLGMLTE